MLKLALKRSQFFILALVIAVSGIVSVFAPAQNAYAVSPDQIASSVKKYLNYQALLSCANDTTNSASFDQIRNWEFFDDTTQAVGHIISADDGMIDCQDGGWVRGVLGEYGHTDPLVFLCAAKWHDSEGGDCLKSQSLVPPKVSQGDSGSNVPDINAFKAALLKGAAEPSINDADNYYLYSQTFIIGCKAKNIGEYSTASPVNQAIVDTDTGYKLKAPNSSYVATEYIYQGDLGKGRDITLRATGAADGTVRHSCINLVDQSNRHVQAYINAIKPGGVSQPGTCGERYTTPDQIQACDDGFANKANRQFCSKYDASAAGPLLGGLSDDGKTLFGIPAPKFTDTFYACLYGNRTATGNSSSTSPPFVPPDTAAATKKTTCNIAGIGWLLCPALTFAGGLIDGAYTFIAEMLTVQPLMTTGDTSGVYIAWTFIRNFANVAFVIAFLIIIFSQVTSVGITNYGIKRMLPRLIVAAILVNVSFWICAIAVDISNILGSSIKGVMETAGANIAFLAPRAETGASVGNTWTTIIAGAITVTAAATTIALTYAALIPALLTCLVIIIAVFFALVLRQVLIILLVVISPLAFVAYLLPGTESLFKKWRTSLQMLLLMYPIIAFIFGASALASEVIKRSGL